MTLKLGENKPEQQSSVSIRLPSVLPGNPDPTQNPRPVPRILLDGADSIGAYGALARVYLNIGTYWERWIQLHNPLIGFVPQKPFKIDDCDQNSVYWQVNKIRTPYLAKYFLKSTPAMRLKDAPGGTEYLKKDADGRPAGVPWDPALKEGRSVFAQNCIDCHSSKQPDFYEEVEEPISSIYYISRITRYIPGTGSGPSLLWKIRNSGATIIYLLIGAFRSI